MQELGRASVSILDLKLELADAVLRGEEASEVEDIKYWIRRNLALQATGDARRARADTICREGFVS